MNTYKGNYGMKKLMLVIALTFSMNVFAETSLDKKDNNNEEELKLVARDKIAKQLMEDEGVYPVQNAKQLPMDENGKILILPRVMCPLGIKYHTNGKKEFIPVRGSCHEVVM